MSCCPRHSIIPSRNRVASNLVTSSRSLNTRGRIEDIWKASEFQTAAQPLNLTVENVESLEIYLSTYFPWLKLCIYKVKPALMSRFLHFKAVKKNLIQPWAIYVFKLFWDYITWHGKTCRLHSAKCGKNIIWKWERQWEISGILTHLDVSESRVMETVHIVLVLVCMLSHLSHVQLFVTLWIIARLLYPWDPPGKNTGVGCHALL